MIRRVLNQIEFQTVRALGRILGISYIQRYLRNPNPQITIKLLRAYGATVGNKTKFKRSVYIDNAFEDQDSTGDFRHLKVGTNCYIGDGVYFDLAGEVEIDDDAVIAGQVAFVTHADCNRSTLLSEQFPRRCEGIRIQTGAWLGFRATVLAGVTVGTNTVVAAQCLLAHNADAAAVYAGTPGRKIRALEESKPIPEPTGAL